MSKCCVVNIKYSPLKCHWDEIFTGVNGRGHKCVYLLIDMHHMVPFFTKQSDIIYKDEGDLNSLTDTWIESDKMTGTCQLLYTRVSEHMGISAYTVISLCT